MVCDTLKYFQDGGIYGFSGSHYYAYNYILNSTLKNNDMAYPLPEANTCLGMFLKTLYVQYDKKLCSNLYFNRRTGASIFYFRFASFNNFVDITSIPCLATNTFLIHHVFQRGLTIYTSFFSHTCIYSK